MADRKRCCCNCERNIRHEVAPYGIECYCDIDGHRIGYIKCFDGWCRRWKKDKTFDGMDKMENTMPDMNDLPLRKGKKTFNYFE